MWGNFWWHLNTKKFTTRALVGRLYKIHIFYWFWFCFFHTIAATTYLNSLPIQSHISIKILRGNCSSLLKYTKIIEFHLPICDCGTMVLCRSHRGEYSRPSSASRSPWLKNSSMHRDVHWWWRSQRFAGWETSQECNIRLRTLVLSKLKFSK